MQTRVGYAGASTPSPTYRNLQDHAEVVRVVFDPRVTTYAALLEYYRSTHKPRRRSGQYRSILFPVDDQQQRDVTRYLEAQGPTRSPWIIAPGAPEARFWDAEDYHQKYRLRRNRAVVPLLEAELGADWDRATIATKLNAAREPGFDVSPWLERLSPQAQRAFRRG